MLFWRVKSNLLQIYKNFKGRPGTGMKGSGSWSTESLHGGTLLGARGKGFVMFSDGEIVRRIMLNQRMWVFFDPYLLVQSDSTFFCLGFLVWYRFVSGHYS